MHVFFGLLSSALLYRVLYLVHCKRPRVASVRHVSCRGVNRMNTRRVIGSKRATANGVPVRTPPIKCTALSSALSSALLYRDLYQLFVGWWPKRSSILCCFCTFFR